MKNAKFQGRIEDGRLVTGRGTYVDDLKRKSFTSSTNFTQQQAFAGDFLTQLAKAFRQKTPLMEFLCNALGRPW